MERKRMRKRSNSRKHGWAGKIEYEVAKILVDLPHLFYKPSPAIAALLNSSSWGSKKRRSAIADDDKDDVVVVNNSPKPKPRRKSGSKKKTKEELLKKFNQLTECRDQLIREVGVVKHYRDTILLQNSILKAARERKLQELYDEEGNSGMVTKRMRTAGIDAATDFPSQQHMPFMYPTHQSCQVLPPEARCSGYGGLNISSNGIPVGCRAMDPSA